MSKKPQIKLSDDIQSSKIDVNNLSKVPDPGLDSRGDGCNTGICDNNRDFGASKYCDNAVCTNGIGVCNERT